MSFFTKLVDTVTDQVEEYVTEKVIAKFQPKVRAEVAEHVEEFKTQAVDEIPRIIEHKIARGNIHDDFIRQIVSSLLSGQVGPLVEKVLKLLKPGIDNLSADLPDAITNSGVQYVREFLDTDVQHKSREAGGDESTFGDKLGGMLNLKDRITSFLESLREKLHPLFEDLKPKIWDLIPDLVREAVEELLGNEDQPEQEQAEGETRSRGIVGDFLKDTFTGQALDQVPKLVTVLEDQVKEIIAKIVNTLENMCNQAFKTKLLDSMRDFSLLKE